MDYPSPYSPNPGSGSPTPAGPNWTPAQPPPPAPPSQPGQAGPGQVGQPYGAPGAFPAAPPPVSPQPQPLGQAPGAAFSPDSQTPAGAPHEPRRRGRWVFPLLLGLLLGGLLTAGGYWLGQQSTNDEPATANGSTGAVLVDDDDDERDEEPAASAPAPLVLDGDQEEPVAAVAQVLAQSVVGLQNDLGEGSGVAYTSTRLITNAHVVGDFTDVTVLLSDGREVAGTVLGTDESRDVAVVEVDQPVLVPATFAPSSSVQVGQLAVAVGSPFGLEQSVTAGIVSAVDRVVENNLSGVVKLVAMVQTDAPINPGNSGGALADRQGRVIGMNTSIRTAGGVNASVGIGFAVPSDTMLLIAERIVNGESLETGFLGVVLRDSVTDPVGAQVTDVNPESAADLAGIEVDDIIVEVGGRPVDGTFALAAAIQIRNPGESVEIVVSRNGDLQTFVAELGSN